MTITISNNKRTFLKKGKSFFYLADTCWSAFTNIQEQDWIEYLKKRKYQGFNTLQINILPQWDRSRSHLSLLPFLIDEHEKFDFSILNEDYFRHAQWMAKTAHDEGFELALVILWSNYVSGTWASELSKTMEEGENIFPPEFLQQYFDKVIETFDQFKPIWVIGGDTDFLTNEATNTYVKTFNYFKKYSPSTLKTIHVRGRFIDIPEAIEGLQDFYFYQSGHNSSHFEMPYTLAEAFSNKKRKLPIINSEPCYEQMGYSRHVYGRFTRRDVRRAAWQSILSGACAGVAYGAHGIWSWQTSDSEFSSDIGEAFDAPMSWLEAINFPGATDYGFVRQFLELNNIDNLIPYQELLINGDPSIRIARSDKNDWIMIYVPSNTTIKLNKNFSADQIILLDLENNHYFSPEVKFAEEKTTISIHKGDEDALIIIKK